MASRSLASSSNLSDAETSAVERVSSNNKMFSRRERERHVLVCGLGDGEPISTYHCVLESARL